MNQNVVELYRYDSLEDPEANRIFKIALHLIGSLGTCLNCLVLLIIYFKSPSAMRKFKMYLLSYQLVSLPVELIAGLCEPVLLPKVLVLYFIGPLDRVPLPVFQLLMVVVVVCSFGVLYLFVVMLLQRYFVMSYDLAGTKPFYKNVKFYLSGCTLILGAVNAVFLFFFLSAFKSGPEAEALVRQMLEDPDRFLSKKVPFVVLDKAYFKPLAVTICLFIPGFSLLLSTVIFLTLFSYFQNVSKFSRGVRRGHTMVIKMLLFQIPAMVFFVACPWAVLTYHIIADSYGNHFLVCVCIIWMFPLMDSLVIIVVIKPYRTFVKRFICIYREVSDSGTQLSSIK